MEDDIQNTSNAPKKTLNKRWLIYFIFIIIIIIGLIIAIVVTNIINNQDSKPKDITANSCNSYTNFDDIQNCITQSFDNDGDLQNLYNNYISAISTSIEKGNYQTAVQLVNTSTNTLAEGNRCKMAQEIINSTDTSQFPDTDLQEFYLNATEISTYCNDEESYQKWNSLYQSLISEEDNETP